VVRIGSSLFTVIGVLKPLDRNPLLPVDPNSSVFITTSAAKRVSGAVSIDTLGGRISPGYELEAVGSRLESEIAKVLPNAHFRIATAKELIDTIRQQSALFTMLLGAIGSISLIVGGVGVMNIMLVSVVERQREIGLRLSIGARRRDIAIMFLVEASILSMVGGLIGFVLGVAASYGFSWYSEAKFFVSEVALLLGVAVSLLIGIFFGYYPARRAASLDPVAALRSE
jgi:putative ABC transport system permease protein